jgi:disulfide bond formation protein DsbB
MGAMPSSRIVVRLFFWIMLAASLGAIAYALTAQYAFGFEPCMLCQYQRIPYWAVAGLALIELSVPGVDRKGVAWLIAFVFACGAVLALYHVGVEQHWWQAGACSAQGPGVSLNFNDFNAAPAKPILKSCDSIDWTLLGLSMATYNVAVSAALALLACCAARTMTKS